MKKLILSVAFALTSMAGYCDDNDGLIYVSPCKGVYAWLSNSISVSTYYSIYLDLVEECKRKGLIPEDFQPAPLPGQVPPPPPEEEPDENPE